MTESAEMTEINTGSISEKPKKKTLTYRFQPNYRSFFNTESERLEYEVNLVGVNKNNVKLKLLEGLWSLKVEQDEGEYIARYSLTRYFPHEIDPKSLESSLNNGLLRFSVKLKDPLSEAVEIKL